MTNSRTFSPLPSKVHLEVALVGRTFQEAVCYLRHFGHYPRAVRHAGRRLVVGHGLDRTRVNVETDKAKLIIKVHYVG